MEKLSADHITLLVEDNVWAIDMIEDYVGRRDDPVLFGSAIEL